MVSSVIGEIIQLLRSSLTQDELANSHGKCTELQRSGKSSRLPIVRERSISQEIRKGRDGEGSAAGTPTTRGDEGASFARRTPTSTPQKIVYVVISFCLSPFLSLPISFSLALAASFILVFLC